MLYCVCDVCVCVAFCVLEQLENEIADQKKRRENAEFCGDGGSSLADTGEKRTKSVKNGRENKKKHQKQNKHIRADGFIAINCTMYTAPT